LDTDEKKRTEYPEQNIPELNYKRQKIDYYFEVSILEFEISP
jgi:hypothetical protein